MINVGDIVQRADTQDAIEYFLRVGVRNTPMHVLEVNRKTVPARLRLLTYYDMSTIEVYEDQITIAEP
jgi:hypothetical protein